MKWFRGLQIRVKIILSFGAMVFFMILLSLFSLVQLRDVEGSFTYAINHPIAGEVDMLEFRGAVREFRRIAATIPALAYQGDMAGVEAYNRRAVAAFDTGIQVLDRFDVRMGADPRVPQQVIDDVLADTAEKRRLLNEYRATVYDPLLAAALAGDAEAADGYLMFGAPIAEALAGRIDELLGLAAYVAAAEMEGASQVAANTFLWLIVLSAAIAIIAMLVALYIAGVITKPLIVSENALQQISESLEAAAAQITDSASSIAEASNEQAASVEETSAAVNEASVMIGKTTENMRVAAKLALQFRQSAASSREKMQKLVDTMHELNESSGAIGKIAKTIDDIAFQTNLLAINATVEAARAGGDAGRSFGVVAEEVRNLSQRSAKSASEATEIIQHDIALVGANEQISMDVAKVLGEIADEFEKLGAIIHEVDEATEDEAAGIKQINLAISHIEKSAQSNAATSQQGAASAAMLMELVGDLKQVYNDVNAVVHGGNALRR